MAEIKISELEKATDLNSQCCFPVVSEGTTKKIEFGTLTDLLKIGNLNDLITTDKTSIVNAINNIVELVCPIGKVEIFFDNEDHSNYMGFTWEKFGEGRALVGIDSNNTKFNAIGKTVGNESNSYNFAHTHTQSATGGTALGVSNLPSRTVVNTKVDMTKNYLDTVTGSITGYNIHCLADSGETSGVAHTHTNPSTNSALGNQAIDTIQPSIVVAFWKRIA